MKLYLSLFICITVFFSLNAQEELGCDPTIYRTPALFEDIVTTNVAYGNNVDNAGIPVALTMDIYDPTDNTAELRPLMVFAHGGSFVAGNRNNLSELCRTYSSMGYVTATIDYRLYNFFGGIPDSLDLLDVAVRSMHDMKAAIRFLKGSIDDGNPFRIDTNFVTIGGISAGAITSVQAAFLESNDTLPEFVADIIEDNGGLEGSTASDSLEGYSSKVQAVINGSGAIYRTEWIDSTDDVSIYSYHGDMDDVVPFGEGVAAPGGIPIITLLGSDKIRERCEEENIESILQDVPGGGHTDIYDDMGIYSDSLTNFFLRSSAFIADRVCEDFLTSTDELRGDFMSISIFPNPVQNTINLHKNFNELQIDRIEIVDLQGRRTSISPSGSSISIPDLIPGLYYLNVWDKDQNRFISKFIKQ